MRALLAPRLWPWHLLVAGVVVLFVTLGFWQLARHGQLQERNARLEARLDAPALPLPERLAGLDPDAPPDASANARYLPATVEGVLLPEHEVLVRGRAYEARPGFHVLTPLRLDAATTAALGVRAGTLLLVNRGWIPFQIDDPVLPPWDPPSGRVAVAGWLEPEADPPTGFLSGLAPRDPSEGPLERIARADVDRLAAQMPGPLLPYVLVAERLAPPGAQATGGAEGDVQEVRAGVDGWVALPVRVATPEPEEGPHLSYALQWWSFALIGGVGYGFLLRERLRRRG